MTDDTAPDAHTLITLRSLLQSALVRVGDLEKIQEAWVSRVAFKDQEIAELRQKLDVVTSMLLPDRAASRSHQMKTLFFLHCGPMIQYGDGMLEVSNLNPEACIRFRMTRSEMLLFAFRCFVGALFTKAAT